MDPVFLLSRSQPAIEKFPSTDSYANGGSRTIRIALLLSGTGKTLENLYALSKASNLPAQIALVISSNPRAFGLTRASRMKVPRLVISRKETGSLEAFSSRIFDECRHAHVDLVCMGGFTQLVQIPKDFIGRVMNIHPALIPAFSGQGYYGHRVHEAVLACGAKVSGCTVHFADNEYDHGPIVLQRTVSVLDDDTPDTLAQRVYEQECEAYPEAIRLFAEGRLRVEGRRVRILPRPPV